MDGFVLVRQGAVRDLADLARTAAAELRNREVRSPLADALVGAAAEVEADIGRPVACAR